MIFKKLRGGKEVNVNIAQYKINWDSSPSKEQQILQDFLFKYWKHKIILAEFEIPGSKFRFDIVNISDRIIVEYSPESTHFKYNKFFHRDEYGYYKKISFDMDKIKWAWQQNPPFKVVEIMKEDLDNLSYAFFEKNFNILL